MSRFANVDRVAVVSLSGQPRVVRGLDLRLFPGAPYGARPAPKRLAPMENASTLHWPDSNAVAVLDARRPTRYRYGLIPTAWYPTALALSRDGRYLYVVNGKGVNGWGALAARRSQAHIAGEGHPRRAALQSDAQRREVQPRDSAVALEQTQRSDRSRRLHRARSAEVRCDVRRSERRCGQSAR